ncbi:LpqB family beta-propeller domain-containing protein [Jatrophihabitans sp. DSM 45814]
MAHDGLSQLRSRKVGRPAGAGQPRRNLVALVVLAVFLLVGCSGVPQSSRPEVVRTLGGNATPTAPEVAPTPGAGPRDIVLGFLNATANSSDANHSGARQFLTTQAGSKWQDTSVTIVADFQAQAQNVNAPDSSSVVVNYQQVGSLDAAGVYAPTLTGSGTALNSTETFTLAKVNGQWRISEPPNGVIITRTTFDAKYNAQKIYFFNAAQTKLVPDVRYSALTDQSALAKWVLIQLVAGPQPQLSQAVKSAMPDQVDGRPPSISLKDTVDIELPGSAQLNDKSQTLLATQLANTFSEFNFSSTFRLLDSGNPVDVPFVGTVFSPSNFSIGVASPTHSAQSFYLFDGGLIDGTTNKPLPGPVGNGAYDLTSVAVRRAENGSLQIAGRGSAGLLIGTSAALAPVRLPPGAIGRPEWQPGTTNVWVGVGDSIYRVGANQKFTEFPLPAPLSGVPGGKIDVIRFSPDGVRVAVIARGGGGHQSLWIGSLSQTTTTSGLDNFQQITPNDMSVDDVAWTTATSLAMIASTPGDAAQAWEIQSDGYARETMSTGGDLPRGLLAVAAAPDAPGQPVAVSSDDPAAVWIQAGQQWTPLASRGSQPTFAQ